MSSETKVQKKKVVSKASTFPKHHIVMGPAKKNKLGNYHCDVRMIDPVDGLEKPLVIKMDSAFIHFGFDYKLATTPAVTSPKAVSSTPTPKSDPLYDVLMLFAGLRQPVPPSTTIS